MQQERPRQGQNAAFEVEISFTEAVSGGERLVSVPLTRSCTPCGGTGSKPGTSPQVCLQCGGTGKVTLSQGAFGVSRPCSTCYGRGKIVTSPCSTCYGTGNSVKQKKVRIKIPAGVADGAKLRLAGQGHGGENGGPPGDLVLTVRVLAHATFRREGRDIHCEIAVNLAQAVLGATIDVPTINGSAKLKVPAGVSSGARLRLKGQGVTSGAGKGGDQYVTLNVEIPKELTGEQRKAFAAFAKLTGMSTD